MSYYLKLLDKYRQQASGRLAYTPQFQLRVFTRQPENTDGLAMRIADPLWVLGRQWQFGEFQGEDNGSPVQVRVNQHMRQVTDFGPQGKGGDHALNNRPPEVMVERLPEQLPTDLKSKVRIGQQYERLLRANFSAAAAQSHSASLRVDLPLTVEGWSAEYDNLNALLDQKSRRFFRLMGGRQAYAAGEGSKVIDGTLLLRCIGDGFPKPEGSANNYGDLEEVTQHFKEWWEKQHWDESYQDRAPSSGELWNSSNLAYSFELQTADGATTLQAPDYQSGHLDWYSFDGARVEQEPDFSEQNDDPEWSLPVNVSFGAMPDKRLFSFEDSNISLDLMDVKAGDMLRMMILDFSLVSGSDWYTIPLRMKLGDLCWVEKIVVKDSFGICTTIDNDDVVGAVSNDPLRIWDVFKIRDTLPEEYDLQDHFLFLAPAATQRLESEPVEELLFVRDEYANMVWAIEKQVPNVMGNSVNGYDLHLEMYGPFQPLDEADGEAGNPKFRLASQVPSNWIPYLPNQLADGVNIDLRRAYMLRNVAEARPTDLRPFSFLAETDLPSIREEAIPRAGVRVQLTRQRLRWTDGRTYVWTGRQVKAGKGEGNSGLRFDYLEA